MCCWCYIFNYLFLNAKRMEPSRFLSVTRGVRAQGSVFPAIDARSRQRESFSVDSTFFLIENLSPLYFLSIYFFPLLKSCVLFQLATRDEHKTATKPSGVEANAFHVLLHQNELRLLFFSGKFFEFFFSKKLIRKRVFSSLWVHKEQRKASW